ncbi:DUF4262 domain-containing protein [Pseudomonas syringae pv. actinidiae]|nr:DUF4262 domain-containing protein [Pseudomonas syringae pv. actinidiae]
MMSPPRLKAQIQDQLNEDQPYRDDLDYIQATLDEGNVFIGQTISAQDGNTEASFCVTVGMYLHQLPEVVMCGVPVPLVKNIVEELCDGHDFDREFLAGGRNKIYHGLNVCALPIERPEHHDVLNICSDVYTLRGVSPVSAVQLIFSNEAGAFPWSGDYREEERQYQPVLGFAGATGMVN